MASQPLINRFIVFLSAVFLFSCHKKDDVQTPVTPANFAVSGILINGRQASGSANNDLNLSPVISFQFGSGLLTSGAASAIRFTNASGVAIPFNNTFLNNDSTISIQAASALQPLTKYSISIGSSLQSKDGGHLTGTASVSFTTGIDSADKFSRISDDSLLTLVQKQTFRYFWDFGHPVSGCARERNTSGDLITTGGTGFGIMAMMAAANRGFISRSDALARVNLIANFYAVNCTSYHGAFAHWINGATGVTIPFSANDDGADLVETSYLMQGLLCARQYFSSNSSSEIALRNTINQLWDAVDWNWFQQGNQNALYWHWSPTVGWAINQPIQGWNEALIVYALAASSRTHPITKAVYDAGWARSGGIKNGKPFYGITLPLGEDYGGPLFFAHYSFLGINPHSLSDSYAPDYWQQNISHVSINYSYCAANPKSYTGYSNECWGLTASDEQNGYSAHSPTNDNGTLTPTAAISSLPYDTAKCMAALRFFYYKLGDKLWGDYGFKDAFNLSQNWFADSYLAIDQGPEIVMIENLRSGLLWNLFMSCSEVKAGMTNLGFQSPYLN